jgi:hypothetical protein
MRVATRKALTLPSVRCTAKFEAAVKEWWTKQQQTIPDMTLASAIRTLIKLGLEKGERR